MLNYIVFKYSKYSWFHSLDKDRFGRIIFYVSAQNAEILSQIPNQIDGRQVLVHFAHYKEFNKNSYTFKNVEEKSKLNLKSTINELKSNCDCVADVFFEIHDAENSITDVSWKFPKVKSKLEDLYNEFGFEAVYQYLDF